MNIKNNSRYKANSEKIETAFLTLILNHKYEDITISDICKQADVNRSTFYCHYDDINDLIIKIEVLKNVGQKLNIDKSNRMGIFYRASFFGAGIKEMCRLWLENDCKETPEQMASLLLDEYKNRDH